MLTSVILRLEELNGLAAGTLVARLRTYKSGAIEPKMLTGTCLDLDLLSDDGGALPLEDVVATTLRSALRWQFRDATARGPSLYRRIHAVCPACAQARVFLLPVAAVPMSACPRHGLLLRSRCTCGAWIDVFRRQRPFTCHACGRDYATLPRVRASPSRVAAARRRARVLSRLIALSPHLEKVGRDGITFRLAELLQQRGGSYEAVRLALGRHATPIDWVVLMLERVRARPSDLLPRKTAPTSQGRAI